MRITTFVICTMLLGVASLMSDDTSAQTLVEADEVNMEASLAGIRLRNFVGLTDSAYLGVPDFSDTTPSDIEWATMNELHWSLDHGLDRLQLNIENGNGQWTLLYEDWTSRVADLTDGAFHPSDLNVMVINVWNRDDEPTAVIGLSDITLNGVELGGFSTVHGQTPPRERRGIVGHCLGTDAGFELRATLELHNLTQIQDNLDRVDFSAGVDPSMGLNCGQPSNTSIVANPPSATLHRGEDLIVSVTLANQGVGAARNIVVELSEPPGLTMTDALAACGSEEPGVTACPVGDIAPEESFDFEFTIRAGDLAEFGNQQFQISFSTDSIDLGPTKTTTVNVTIANDVDAIFSDRFQPAD
ncbi:MAG: hypothetical protein ACNA7J_09695 [Wenzhouxiangella sp.]